MKTFEADVTQNAERAMKSLTKTAGAYKGTPWGGDPARVAVALREISTGRALIGAIS